MTIPIARHNLVVLVTGLFCLVGMAQTQEPPSSESLDTWLKERRIQAMVVLPQNGDQQLLAVLEESTFDEPRFRVLDMRANFRELFSIRNTQGWERLTELTGGRLVGFVLFTSHPSFWYGETTIVVQTPNGFEKVFSGDSSEIVDLNGDGFPELVESVWPDGDGFPKKCRVHVWDGQRFRFLIRTNYSNRMSSKVLSAINAYEKRRPSPNSAGQNKPKMQ